MNSTRPSNATVALKRPKRERGLYIELGFAQGSRERLIRMPYSAFPFEDCTEITGTLLRGRLYNMIYVTHASSGFYPITGIKGKEWVTMDTIKLEIEK